MKVQNSTVSKSCALPPWAQEKREKEKILNAPELKELLGDRTIVGMQKTGFFKEAGQRGMEYLIATNDPNYAIVAKVIYGDNCVMGPIPLKAVEFQVKEISTKATGFFPNWNPTHSTDLRA